MMRRLGRRWQMLHRLVYLIAVLGVWHFYWQVKRDVREPLLYAGILAVLLGYRVLRAIARRRAAATRSLQPASARPAEPVTSRSRSAPTLRSSASD
jgi:DMSO/TMAO reductase YedYZ heme-binding membrane subunit